MQILTKIKQELKANSSSEYKKSEQRFFKEKIKTYGVSTPIVRQIANKYWSEIKGLNKEEIFVLCERLLKTGYIQDSVIALAWARKLEKQYNRKDYIVFENWLKKYITNWATCDDFCTHAFGELLVKFPNLVKCTTRWRKSRNRWLRRASVVVLIKPVKIDKQFLKSVFEACEALLEDQNDLVQKGYGWLLKEASNIYRQEVFGFVMKHKTKMPRTALRYAIEKMPKDLKQRAMVR